jgi:hypothetical protein
MIDFNAAYEAMAHGVLIDRVIRASWHCIGFTG